MKIFEGDKRAQGATEYLLMLAAVLVVVAVAVSMLMGMGPDLAVASPASVQDEEGTDQIVVNTADMDVSPTDAVISSMTLFASGNEVETITIGQTVDNMAYTYTTTAAGADTTASDITEIIIEDSDGNTTTMTPIVK